MTTIIRGMVTLGTLSNRLPHAEVNILRRLQDLYFRELPQHDSARPGEQHGASTMVPAQSDHDTGGHTRPQRLNDTYESPIGPTLTYRIGSIEQRPLDRQT